MTISSSDWDDFYQFARSRLGDSPALQDLEVVVNAYRKQRQELKLPPDRTPIQDLDEWRKALHRWAEGFPKLPGLIDDSRDSIYSDDRA